MSRVIKFRRAHFKYGSEVFDCFSYWGPIKGGFQSPSSISSCFYKEGTDMQFTGLLDKNGKEIYEGDIVNVTQNKKKNAVMDYDIGIKDIAWERGGLFLSGYSNDLEWHCNNSDVEVIGNIYETPELIN
jgi:uncharacterized phage protein (TIGR01671 family)